MKPRMITIAIMALGGQGGGVLEDWITTLAEDAGWTAQATSVAGVAQRTGATIYYIELVEPTPRQTPVLAQMPIPGEVDILIAAELMEAGRAVARGLVTPNRTTVVTSTHRTYAVQEKMVPGDGAADSAGVLDLVRQAARRVVADDMQALAVNHGSMISASLFGALAGCDVLPFHQQAFEQVVERGGKGAQASLETLRAGAELARTRPTPPALAAKAEAMKTAPRPLPGKAASPALAPLLARIRQEFAQPAWPWLGEGLARVVDWQDVAYGSEYLDNVARLARRDPAPATADLTIAAAHWIAVAMSYDDVIRVADLKTRAERFARIRGEVGGQEPDLGRNRQVRGRGAEEVAGDHVEDHLLPRFAFGFRSGDFHAQAVGDEFLDLIGIGADDLAAAQGLQKVMSGQGPVRDVQAEILHAPVQDQAQGAQQAAFGIALLDGHGQVRRRADAAVAHQDRTVQGFAGPVDVALAVKVGLQACLAE